jgi:hypothetical protein
LLRAEDEEGREGGEVQTIAGTGSVFFDSHVEEWESWRVRERREGGREGGRKGGGGKEIHEHISLPNV